MAFSSPPFRFSKIPCSAPRVVMSLQHSTTLNIRVGVSGCLNNPNLKSIITKTSKSLTYNHSKGKLKIISSETSTKKMRSGSEVVVGDTTPIIDGGSGEDDGNKKFSGGGGGGGGGGDDEVHDYSEFGPIMTYKEAVTEAEMLGVTLPPDMLEAIKTEGIRKLYFTRFMDLQLSGWPVSLLMEHSKFVRHRMLADPSFLFKVGREVVIDSCCATIEEVIKKRRKDFWADSELFTTNLSVGVVVDIALVGILAPYARIGNLYYPIGHSGVVSNFVADLPSSVFEFGSPGCRFSLLQRTGTFFYKGVLFGLVGSGCSVVGQGIAHMLMTAKRSTRKSEDEASAPLLKNPVLFGIFLMASSNTRYQVLNGLDFMVQALPLARQVPLVTLSARVANNVYGRMQFSDWLCAVKSNAKREGNDMRNNHALV